VKRAAARFDVHDRTVRRWIAEGLITGYRVGSTLIKVDLNEIEDRIVRVIPPAEARP
jgi:excisionase family DNA binding protein